MKSDLSRAETARDADGNASCAMKDVDPACLGCAFLDQARGKARPNDRLCVIYLRVSTDQPVLQPSMDLVARPRHGGFRMMYLESEIVDVGEAFERGCEDEKQVGWEGSPV